MTPDPSAPGFTFSKSGVEDGEPIDQRYSCDGDDVSPALAWEGVPEGSAGLALLMEDPDAPGGTFTHWLVYGLDPAESGLPEGLPHLRDVTGPPALRQGSNDFGTLGYGGPCPPEGTPHNYVFTLYALDEATALEGGASVDDLRAAIEGHILGEATLAAPYSRS